MMTAELVPIIDAGEIAELPIAERSQMITQALVESKSWLAVATKGTDPRPIAEFKAWAATISEMTKQKGLAEEIQLDALEMVRRAERGIGVAIRHSQEAGLMAKRGDIGSSGAKGCLGGIPGSSRGEDLDLPSRYFTSGSVQTETYALTDGVSDEQFEEALQEAREEKALSRANVLRKIEGASGPRVPLLKRLDELAELAAAGVSSRQMERKLGHTGDYIRKVARDNNITIPADQVISRTLAIDPERVIRETVNTLQGIEASLSLLSPADYDAFPVEQVKDWLTALEGPNRAIRNLTKELKIHVRSNTVAQEHAADEEGRTGSPSPVGPDRGDEGVSAGPAGTEHQLGEEAGR